MGCKNMGGSSAGADYRDHQAAMGMMAAAAAYAAMQHHRQPQHVMNSNGSHPIAPRPYGMLSGSNGNSGVPPRQPLHHDMAQSSSNDPWIAAQSLTFLKRGSPGMNGFAASHPPNRPYSMGVSPITKSPGSRADGGQENVSIPSLSSSSEGTSPGDGVVLNNRFKNMSTPESFKGENNALLLAAVAMTEFGQSPPPTSSMLSPETIRTYNTCTSDAGNDTMDEDLSTTEEMGNDTPRNAASKRSINFDDLTDSEGKDLSKKVKATDWMM
jgi:hypothetical protein